MLLNKPITLDDIEANDPDLHKSLNWMLTNNIHDIIGKKWSPKNIGQVYIKCTWRLFIEGGGVGVFLFHDLDKY